MLTVLEHGSPIYTATLRSGVGTDELTVQPTVANYTIRGAFPAAKDAIGRTFVVRISSNSGVYLGALEFHYDALRTDSVLFGHTKYESVENFRARKAVGCR